MRQKPRVRPSWPLYVLFALLAGIVGAVVSYGFLTESLAALGIPDPGPLTTAGLPFLRSVVIILGCLAVGSFLASTFLVRPQPGDLRTTRLSVDGHLAARTGAYSALSAAAGSLLLVPMYLSDVSGEPLVEALKPANWSVAIGQVSTSLAFCWVAGIAAITGIGALFSTRWIMQPIWLLGAIFIFVPLGLEGHSATGGDHDYGTNSYLWHLIFTALWVGGLMALIAHGRRKGADMELAVARYSGVALASVIVLAISGLINAAIRIHWGDWLTTGYGRLITAKAIGVIVLAIFGFIHRQRTIPKLATDPGAFRRIAAVEVAVMAAIIGVAISLGRTPPPPPRSPDINTMDIQLGYKLFVEPTVFNVFTMWRFDIVFGTIAILLAAAYLWALRRVEHWPWWRTAWFLLGCATLLITMCSGIGLYMPALFSVHMVGHMILSMVVPVFWVLGGPLTLFKQAAAAPGHEHPDVLAWLEVAEDNPIVRFLTHPAVNTIQFVVLFYGLYVEPLYTTAVSEHAGHLGMNIMFLLSGTVYFWELIGVDPIPHPTDPKAKIMWLTFSLPVHMFFGVTLMMMQQVLAYDFYSTLGLPWEPDLLHDQLVGGGIAWASGQFPLVIVYFVIVRQFFQADKKEQQEYDAHADATDDEEMAAYNAMLAQINAGQNPLQAYEEQEFGKS